VSPHITVYAKFSIKGLPKEHRGLCGCDVRIPREGCEPITADRIALALTRHVFTLHDGFLSVEEQNAALDRLRESLADASIVSVEDAQ